jgi:hypothetical protein
VGEMTPADWERFRRAIRLRDRCRAAAVDRSHYLEVPMTPTQANVAFDAMVDIIRDHDREETSGAYLGEPDPDSGDL